MAGSKPATAAPFPDVKISSITLPSTETTNVNGSAQKKDRHDDKDAANCGHVSNLLAPLSDNEIDAGNPAMVDIGLLAILGLFDQGDGLPPPLNQATAAELVSWWQGSLATDSADATTFLRAVARLCMKQACSTTSGIGEADIGGIGVHVANTMLAVIVVCFWVFGLTHSPGPAHNGIWRHTCAGKPLCGAMRATIDDVFDGALVFSISLHVATLSYSHPPGGGGGGAQSDAGGDSTRYEVTFAQTSCTFAALSVITLWHIRSEISRPRLYTRLFFCAMCALALAVFVLRAMWHLYPTTFWDEACVNPINEVWWQGRELFDFLCAAYFGLALLATFLPLSPLASRLFPYRVERKKWLARNGLISKLRFCQSFLGAGGIFVYMIVMNQSRSNFQDENTWSIGQYLAVATWVPSIAKLLYVLCTGMETSLTNYLPLPWIAAMPPTTEASDDKVDCETGGAESGVSGEGGGDEDRSDVGTNVSSCTDLTAVCTDQEEEAPVGTLIRRDSDMTVVGDSLEPDKTKDPKDPKEQEV